MTYKYIHIHILSIRFGHLKTQYTYYPLALNGWFGQNRKKENERDTHIKPMINSH